MDQRKSYLTVMRLGVSTDSHDAEGQVIATAPVDITRDERDKIEEALSNFRGTIHQKPPMVSAIKHKGQPLYKLARQGIQVERRARPVTFYELELVDWSPPDLTLSLTCSSGTYVRALARDLGEKLGYGAHLTALTRLASGAFTQSQALAMDQFAAAVAAQDWKSLVLPLDAGLQQFPACTLEEQESRRIRSGQPLPANHLSAPRDQLCRAYVAHDNEQNLIALLKFDVEAQLWRPHKVFRPL
jgi:tRNA pseudouridine55 synthase